METHSILKFVANGSKRRDVASGPYIGAVH